MNTTPPASNTIRNSNKRKKKAKKKKNQHPNPSEATVNINVPAKDTLYKDNDEHEQATSDLKEAVPSSDKDPDCTQAIKDMYTMTAEHTELYKKLVCDLEETVLTNDKVIETAQCRKLMETYVGDLIARRKAYRPWGGTNTIKKFDDAVIKQLRADIMDPLEIILRKATHPVSVVFYNTMKGDYYRHMAEYLADHNEHNKTLYQDKALSAFLTAKESATSSSVSANDPLYLELHLSLAKLYHFMGMYRAGRLINEWASRASRDCEDQQDEEDRKLSSDIRERMRRLNNKWLDEAVFRHINMFEMALDRLAL